MTIEMRRQIRDFLHKKFPNAEIADDQDIFALGYVNSLFAMELVLFIEQAFGDEVPNEDLEIDNFRSVDAMTAMLERRRAAA